MPGWRARRRRRGPARVFGPRRAAPPSAGRRLQMYSDPLQHACIAAAVVAPLVRRSGRGVLVAAVVPALAIDADHLIAARSVRVGDITSLATRPRTHSALGALGAGAVVAAATGPVHGWATFAGLASHLLHDAGDRAAPTPVLWPFAPARQLGRARQLALSSVLLIASLALSRATAAPSTEPLSAAAGDGGAASPPRTA